MAGGAALPAKFADLLPGIIARAESTGWEPWLAHVAGAAGCASPVRLRGDLITADGTTGHILSARTTHTMPDGVVYKACGTRRAHLCPSCAKTYQHDAFHLIRSGLTGGKGVPATVVGHPAVFVTFTAPAFGPVHARRRTASGAVAPCHARRDAQVCPHGVTLACAARHGEDAPELGQPLCLDCYDHAAQVVWNGFAGELWRRTRIGLDRALARTAKAAGLDPASVRLRYVKVAEFQRRGAIHFHALIRLDGHLPGDDAVIPPPPVLDAETIAALVTDAAAGTEFTTPGHAERPGGWRIGWGSQIDVRTVELGAGELTEGHAAGYLAKYATKATEDTGHVSRRLTEDTVEAYADPAGDHIARLIHACWSLGEPGGQWLRLRRWAHMLGFGGHFLTKARVWSTTFASLREARAAWTRCQLGVDTAEPDTTVLVNHLVYDGQGWHTEADALMANSAAARAREQRQVAREELWSIQESSIY
ncbi:replication initiator [Glycomyces tenuis]|uniref:replication initiator n=1 Tax=Glycomyces tenuis TaxID=58116 RepID=UPI0009DC13ED|nr:replication initiator [Glycomyces tenuis]